MENTVAKKYVKALFDVVKSDEYEKVAGSLGALACCFETKLGQIVGSPYVEEGEKLGLVLLFADGHSREFQNFLKVLSQNKRLCEIPLIAREFERELAVKNGKFEATFLSDFALSDEQKASLQKSLSAKFNASVEVEKGEEKFSGAKVSVDGLGVEIGVSIEKLKSQLVEHILKAI